MKSGLPAVRSLNLGLFVVLIVKWLNPVSKFRKII